MVPHTWGQPQALNYSSTPSDGSKHDHVALGPLHQSYEVMVQVTRPMVRAMRHRLMDRVMDGQRRASRTPPPLSRAGPRRPPGQPDGWDTAVPAVRPRTATKGVITTAGPLIHPYAEGEIDEVMAPPQMTVRTTSAPEQTGTNCECAEYGMGCIRQPTHRVSVIKSCEHHVHGLAFALCEQHLGYAYRLELTCWECGTPCVATEPVRL